MRRTERSLHTLALLVITFLSKETYIMQCEVLHRVPRAGAMFGYYAFLVFATLVLTTQLYFKATRKEVSDETK